MTDPDGKVLRIVRELPPRTGDGRSSLSPRLPGVKKFSRRGLTDFPADLVLPRSMPRPGAPDKVVYPALSDDPDGVAVKLFLREDDALAAHRKGAVALFKLGSTQQIKYFRRAFKPDKNMLLSLFGGDYSHAWADDLLDAAILAALGGAPENARDHDSWSRLAQSAREILGEVFDRQTRVLKELFGMYEKVEAQIGKLSRRPGADETAVREHLDELFAPGFLRRPALWNGDYRRYLRALELRAQRMSDNPARDAEKAAALGDYPEKIRLLCADYPDLADRPALCGFWKLYEEAAVNCFAPEVQCAIRGAVNKLDTAWEELRL